LWQGRTPTGCRGCLPWTSAREPLPPSVRMPPLLRLRPFAPDDAAVVGPWLDGPGVSLPPGGAAHRWAERMCADPRVRAFVVQSDGEVAGFARLDLGPDRVAELTIAVATGGRRRGVGSQLLQLVLVEAERIHVRRVQALVDPQNEPAMQFFDAAGFEATATVPGKVTFVRWLHGADPRELEVHV
jgi:L-amino acid N-acyltransferase YncA